MKKTIKIMGVAVLSSLAMLAQAQTDTTKPVAPQTTEEVKTQTTSTTNTWDPKKNPTVAEINSRYEGKYIAARPAMTDKDIYPVLGAYESATNPDAASVSISLDAENRGIVWIDGLPQGRIKAMLRKSPATYKIPAQQTADGKSVAEGTLMFDQDTKTLSIIIGKDYNMADPAAAFVAPAIGSVDEATANADVKVKNTATKSKTKVKKQPEAPKPWTYTGTKIDKETAMQ